MDSASNDSLMILVVEDVDWIRAGMKKSLMVYGHRVVEATNHEEAISLAGRLHPDLILTEEELPTFDDLLRSIHEHPALERIPIVIINPDAEESDSHGEVVILTDYSQLKHVSTLPRNS